MIPLWDELPRPSRQSPRARFAAALGVSVCLLCAPAPGRGGIAPQVSGAKVPEHGQTVAQLQPCDGIRRTLTSDQLGLRDDADAWEVTSQFYDIRPPDATWFRGDGSLAPSAHELVEVIAAAETTDGLDGRAYGLEDLRATIDDAGTESLSRDQRCRVGVALTYRLALYATDLARGRVAPEDVDFPIEVDLQPSPPAVTPVIVRALETHDIAGALRRLRPSHPWYTALARGLDRYRAIAADGEWPRLDDDIVLEAGDMAEASVIRTLELRLEREGYLASSRASAGVRTHDNPAWPVVTEIDTPGVDVTEPKPRDLPYDSRLEEAVRNFQTHHGLEPDGIVGPNTLEALNVPVETRLRSIAMTLDQLRWLPRSPDEPLAVVVNVPGYELHAIDHGTVALRLRTIVGRRTWKTPLLTSRIEKLVVNPRWYVPQSILQAELAGRIEREPDYLARQSMTVLDARSGAVVDPDGVDWAAVRAGKSTVRLRQEPGPINALGRIKFIFPSRFGVYLHDTNAQSLFQRPERALSHGCVRLDRPFDLVDLLLQRADAPQTLRQARKSATVGRPESVRLEPAVPVHLVYWTATPHDDGRIQFHPDVYDVEPAIQEALVRSGRASL